MSTNSRRHPHNETLDYVRGPSGHNEQDVHVSLVDEAWQTSACRSGEDGVEAYYSYEGDGFYKWRSLEERQTGDVHSMHDCPAPVVTRTAVVRYVPRHVPGSIERAGQLVIDAQDEHNLACTVGRSVHFELVDALDADLSDVVAVRCVGRKAHVLLVKPYGRRWYATLPPGPGEAGLDTAGMRLWYALQAWCSSEDMAWTEIDQALDWVRA